MGARRLKQNLRYLDNNTMLAYKDKAKANDQYLYAIGCEVNYLKRDEKIEKMEQKD